jgi:hypothetical protein
VIRFSPCAFALKGLHSATARLSKKRMLLNMISSADVCKCHVFMLRAAMLPRRRREA